MEANFSTPILFLIFNRLDTTQAVFDAIKRQRPKYLYVAADGPRPEVAGEAASCQAARDIIKQIDWDCELKTLFRDTNLGCGQAVSGAITWFLAQVEAGIIIEDDCLPNETFFIFCSRLLNQYKDDHRVMMISGTNHLLNQVEMADSYFFSRVYTVWGWATWRRAWNLYDINMTAWPEYKKNKSLNEVFANSHARYYFKDSLDRAYDKKADTWDTQWVFSCLVNNGLTIMPKYNLVTNIGLVGTHTVRGDNSSVGRASKNFDCSTIIHPAVVEPNLELENKQLENSGITKFSFKSRVMLYLKSKLFK